MRKLVTVLSLLYLSINLSFAGGPTIDVNWNPESLFQEVTNGSTVTGQVTITGTSSYSHSYSVPGITSFTGDNILNLDNLYVKNGGSTVTSSIIGYTVHVPVSTVDGISYSGSIYFLLDANTYSAFRGAFPYTFVGYNSPVIITQPQSATMCGNNMVELSVSATGSNLTYLWGDGSNTTLAGNNITVSGAGNYTVTVTGKSGATAISNIAQITDLNTKILSFTQTAIECPGDFTSFLVSALGDNLQYSWNTGGQSDEVITTSPGTYMVTVSGTCGTEVSNSLTLQTLNCSTSGINPTEKTADDFTIFPNPNDGNFIVESNYNGAFEIINIYGFVVYSEKFTSPKTFITKSLASGIYAIKLGFTTKYFLVK